MRDPALLSIRPKLSLDCSLSTPFETFQNEVIRPILKLQNEYFIHCIRSSVAFKKSNFNILSLVDKERLLTKILNDNARIKLMMLSATLGMMSSSELLVYEENSGEYKRRIYSMLEKRILNQMAK